MSLKGEKLMWHSIKTQVSLGIGDALSIRLRNCLFHPKTPCGIVSLLCAACKGIFQELSILILDD